MEEKAEQKFNETDFRNLFQNQSLRFGLLVLICLTLGFIDGFRSFTGTYHNGVFHGYFYGIMRWDMIGWTIWIALIPFVLWLCNRFPINQNNWQKSLVIFIPIGILLAVARTFFPALIHILFIESLADLQHWLPGKFYILITDFVIGFSFYLLVVTFGQAKNYYKQLQEEELRSTKLEAQLSKAQLQALKMQLHPHFLFNVLNSIAALQLENPKDAQEMTVRLGDFLRMTLKNIGVQEVTLEKEVEMLKCYLDIEKIRFGNRLSTTFSVSPDVIDFQIPNLILQPIVENAVKHGIAPQTAKGQINIKANQTNGRLKVEIEDNGQGIKDTNNIFSNGVGLSNTQARLTQLYGEDYRFDFDSPNGKGLLVTLCLPIAKTELSSI